MKKRQRGKNENFPPQRKRAKRPRGKQAPGPARGGKSSEVGAANNHPVSAPAASGQRLTTDDALTYLKDVKEKLKDDQEKYDKFLEVMKDLEAQRVDTASVITRVKDLLEGDRKLVFDFNKFLPGGYEITLPLPPGFYKAMNYVTNVRFHVDEHVYKAFLGILSIYRKGNKSIEEVKEEVVNMFENHGDLLEEFATLLPGSLSLEVEEKQAAGVDFDQALSYVNKVKVRFQTIQQLYRAFLETLNMYKQGNWSISEVHRKAALLFKNHSDLLEEFKYFTPGSTVSTTHPNVRPMQHPKDGNTEYRSIEGTSSDPILEQKHKIFLSHSGVQKEFVEHLCEALERRFHYPFFDKCPYQRVKGFPS